jgi:hypothetical protein
MQPKVLKLVGGTAREIGILVLVFAPLEALYREPRAIALDVGPLVAMSLLLITLGIILEAEEQVWRIRATGGSRWVWVT